MDSTTIKEIQESLRLLSFYDPRLFPVSVDGKYSSQTALAVRIFQTLYGLNPTGTVDNETWENIRDTANQYRSATVSTIDVFPDLDTVIQINDENVTVGFIQLMLQELSRYYSNIEFIEMNGVYDDATAKEIRNIQSLHRLEANGNTDYKTWNVLTTLFHNRYDTIRR